MQNKNKFFFSADLLSVCIIYIVLIAWGIATVYPLFWVIQNSFKVQNKILENSFALPLGELFTTANYKRAFGSLNIMAAYRNSIFISAAVCLIVLLLAGMAGFALVRYRFRGKRILFLMLTAGMMFPLFSTIIPVFAMEKAWGIVNTGSWWLSMLSIILPQSAGNMAFAIVVLSSYMQSLPIELEEAAYLEGCSVRHIFFRVVVPLTKPCFATAAVFVFLWSYNDLFTQMFFLRRQDTMAITRLLNELTAREGTDYGLMAAAVTLVVIPVFCVYIFLQKYMISGMTINAVRN